MKISKWILAVGATLALPVIAAAGPMKPGKWEITVATEIAGTEVSVPPTTLTECVTSEEAANPQPPAAGEGSDCAIADYKINGNVITWSVSCPKENLTGSGSMTFSGDTYNGVTKMKIGDTSIAQKLTGKLLGPCEK